MKIPAEILYMGAGFALIALSASAGAMAIGDKITLENTGDYDYRGSEYALGIRSNNPGNIERKDHTNWLGQVESTGRYIVFSDIRYGIRAMARVLDSYAKRGVDTVSEIISTWAPEADDNNTTAYIYSVSARSGLTPLASISRENYPALIEAMIYHENGAQPLDMATINEGITLA